MPAYCIPRKNIESMKKIFSKMGDNQIADIIDKEFADKVKLFKNALPEEEAVLFAKEFEKAVSSKRLRALGDLIRNNLDESSSIEKEIADIKGNFKEIDAFIKATTDNIGEKIEGVSLTKKEVEEALRIGKRQENAIKKVANTPRLKGDRMSADYVKALSEQYQAVREADRFVMSKAKVSFRETLNSHLKAVMLISPKSIAINVISNAEKSLFDESLKRISSRKVSGYNSELASDMAKTMYKISQDTSETLFGKKIGVGYDLSRSLSLDNMLEKNIIGERMEVGRDTWFTRFVFETGLGRADYRSGRINFTDSLNLYSSKMADEMGLKGTEAKKMAREIMLDAFELTPQTLKGKKLREMAVKDALHATWTDKRALSETLLKIRESINKATKFTGLKIGDLLEPFVKTPANIIQFGTDISGLGIPKSAYKYFKLQKNKSVLSASEAEDLVRGSIRDLTGAIGGIGSAMFMASFINDDEFISAYDPNRTKYDELRNSNSNSVKVFGHWVSLDYNILAVPLVGILYAKKYGGENTAEQLVQYAYGIGSQISKAPIISTLYDTSLDISRKFGAGADKEDLTKYLGSVFVDQIASRIPSVLQDIAQLSDNSKRDITKASDKFLAKIPGLSKLAPEKKDMLGDVIKTEVGNADTESTKFLAGVLQIMTGARVRKEKSEPLRNEILRLKDEKFAPTITDWKYRIPPKLEKLKEKVGNDEYQRIFTEDYGVKLKKSLQREIEKKSYQDLSNEDKKKRLDKLEDVVINSIYSKNKIK